MPESGINAEFTGA